MAERTVRLKEQPRDTYFRKAHLHVLGIPDMMHTMRYESPIGELLLAEKDDSLVGLWMKGQKHYLGTLGNEPREDAESDVLLRAKEWLNRYFAGEKPAIRELPLAPVGSDFQKEVWSLLREVPYGEFTTYGRISRKLARQRGLSDMSAQAVGRAIAYNPLCIIVPCHRVVGANGSLTGYAGGLSRKIWLLSHEGVDVEQFSVPTRGTAL